VLAAARAGIKRVLLPKRNEKDFEDIPESARKTLELVWLETVDDAIEAAIGKVPSDTAPPAREPVPAE
jgi:ATP-dependent Lon protease